ncbi:ngoBVM [Symbiodinium sp. CCMP2592]|nr:ngoBVM [Symbiodinium sp. CCMP2592]
MGTFCSGTDCPIQVWENLLQVLGEYGGGSSKCSMEHVFSCEQHAAKQRFLQSMYPSCKQMFGDVLPMSRGACKNLEGCWVEPMPETDWIAAGFPCDDASCLNSRHRTEEHRLCVAKGGLRTGSVFQAICRYLENMQTECFIFENVSALSKPPLDAQRREVGPSNLSSVVHLLRACGRWTHVWQLNSTLFGSAQSRPRLWGVSFRLEDLAMDEACAHELLDELMSHCAQVECNVLDDYLLSEQDPILQAQRREALSSTEAGDGGLDIGRLFDSAGAVGTPPKSRVARKRLANFGTTQPGKRSKPTAERNQGSPKWAAAHREAFKKLDQDERQMVPNYMDPTNSLLSHYPVLGKLTQRQAEILQLKGVHNLPEKRPRVIDLSQQLSFATLVEDRMPCITPSGAKMLTHRARFLHGIEAMRFQGLEFDEHKLACYSNRFLNDLAGNAFEGGSCSATSFACLVFLAINQQCSRRSRSGPQRMCSAGLPEDELEEVRAAGSSSSAFLDIFD